MIKVDRHINKWNIIENLEIATQKYGKFIFDTGTERVRGGTTVFLTNGA